jgi:CBS domain-containing protein
MKIERLFTRRVVAVARTAQLAEAAAAMQRFNVGTLLVVEGPSQRPVGIVTDRDLAIQGFAAESTTVDAAMTAVLATVSEACDSHEALQAMRTHGVRALVVLAGKGEVCGILSVQELIDGLSTDLALASAVLRGGQPASSTRRLESA